MRTTLKWLHISDIHFNSKTEWRDRASSDSLIEYLTALFKKDESLRPDMVFCTGDIAFGETGSSPLSDQYKQATVFLTSFVPPAGRMVSPCQRSVSLSFPATMTSIEIV